MLLAVGGPPYHVLLLSGYGEATSGAGALLVTGLVPVLGITLSFIVKREGTRWQAVGGGLLVLAGIVVFGGLATSASFTPAGLAIFFAAALAWAVLNQLVRMWRVDPWRLTVALAAWAPLFLPVYLVAGSGGEGLSMSPQLILQVVYHGVVVAFGATLLFFAAIKMAGAHRAAALLGLVPPLAALLGFFALGEAAGWAEATGTLLVLGGIALTAFFADPPNRAPSFASSSKNDLDLARASPS